MKETFDFMKPVLKKDHARIQVIRRQIGVNFDNSVDIRSPAIENFDDTFRNKCRRVSGFQDNTRRRCRLNNWTFELKCQIVLKTSILPHLLYTVMF